MDVLSDQERDFSNSIKGIDFLIADASSTRKSIRKLLSHFHVKAEQITIAQTYSDAVEMLQRKRPGVVFTDSDLPGGDPLTLAQAQEEALETDSPRAFFLLSARDSKIVLSGAAEEGADRVLIKPFTFNSLKSEFISALGEKLHPSAYMKLLQQCSNQMKLGKMQDALKLALTAKATAKNSNQKPTMALACEGMALRRLGHPDKAFNCFKEALEIQPNHYRSMIGLLDCLIDKNESQAAYAVARKLAAEHPIPIKRLPDLIRLSVVNRKFEDVLGFVEIADAVVEFEPSVAKPVAAGLVVCGLYCIRNQNKDRAIEAFRKAEMAAKQNYRILTRMMLAIVEVGLQEELKNTIARLPPEVRGAPEVRLAEFKSANGKISPFETISHGENLLKEGIKDKDLYEVLIRTSIQLKRRQAVVEELVQAALNDFPEEKSRFEALKNWST